MSFMVMCRFKSLSCSEKKEVSGCSDLLQADRDAFLKVSPGTAGPAGLRKMVQNRKANCFALLKRITNLKCQFRCQVWPQSPAEGLPQVAPWHHVGVTMDITLDKLDLLRDPSGTESFERAK